MKELAKLADNYQTACRLAAEATADALAASNADERRIMVATADYWSAKAAYVMSALQS